MVEPENHDSERANDGSQSTSRRAMLRTAGASATALTGLAATTGSASAQLFDGIGGGIGGGGGVPEFELDGFGAANELPNSNESELVIYLHGAGVSSTAGSQGESLEDGLAGVGYDTTVIAGVFSTTGVGIGDGSSEAAENLAGMIEDYYDTTGGSIHIVGYSLGGILTMQTLSALDNSYTVDTAASLGTGTPDSTVCEGNVYHDGIESNAEEFLAITSDNDSAVDSMNAADPGCGGGGGFFGGGGGGSPPDNLRFVDVTQEVPSHMDYLDSTMVMQALSEAFGGDGGGSDPSNGSDGDGSDFDGFDGFDGFDWFGSDSGFGSGGFGSGGFGSGGFGSGGFGSGGFGDSSGFGSGGFGSNSGFGSFGSSFWF